MRAPVAALRPFLVTATREAREKLAAELYGLDRVKDLATTAALAGATDVCVRQEQPVDLHKTAAASALESWAVGVKLRVEWTTRLIRAGDGRDIRVHEPVLSWEPDAR